MAPPLVLDTSRARVALVGDTHGALDPRVHAALAEADVDAIAHTGDVGAARVLDALGALASHVVAVQGNNDVAAKWPAADRARLDTLPDEATLALPGGALVVTHGHRFPARVRHAKLRAHFADARAIAIGHSHHPGADQDARPWVLNPGVAGFERAFGGPGFYVVTATKARWTVRAHRFAPATKEERAAAR